MDEEFIINRLEQRISNLEVALMAMGSILEHMQPPETQDDIASLLEELYESNKLLGGYRRPTIDVEGWYGLEVTGS